MLPKEDDISLKEDGMLPKEDSMLPKEDSMLPKEARQILKEAHQILKEAHVLSLEAGHLPLEVRAPPLEARVSIIGGLQLSVMQVSTACGTDVDADSRARMHLQPLMKAGTLSASARWLFFYPDYPVHPCLNLPMIDFH